jgi:GNAT superfamily N-acetyltransferase
MQIVELNSQNINEYLPQCLGLQKHLVSEGTPVEEEQFIATAIEQNSYFVGLFEENTLAGMGVMSKIVHPVATNGYINNIVVSPDFRGKGYFSVIMDELERKAKEWKCVRVDLSCSRELVQKLYEKRGYMKKETNFYILKLS